jgi:hypothetical protein
MYIMPKPEAQRQAQQKYQRSRPRAMIETKNRYREKNIEPAYVVSER